MDVLITNDEYPVRFNFAVLVNLSPDKSEGCIFRKFVNYAGRLDRPLQNIEKKRILEFCQMSGRKTSDCGIILQKILED